MSGSLVLGVRCRDCGYCLHFTVDVDDKVFRFELTLGFRLQDDSDCFF